MILALEGDGVYVQLNPGVHKLLYHSFSLADHSYVRATNFCDWKIQRMKLLRRLLHLSLCTSTSWVSAISIFIFSDHLTM